jgi:hypothetical protein
VTKAAAVLKQLQPNIPLIHTLPRFTLLAPGGNVSDDDKKYDVRVDADDTGDMNESVSISRATSVSRASSKHGSAVSRQQSLIKKSIAPHDLRPSDILIERFTAWKVIVKQLMAYFEVCVVSI